jgi:hypothetical protein
MRVLSFAVAMAVALVVGAAPRGHACEVDDDLQATEEGIPHDNEPTEAGGATKSMSCELLVPGPHLKVTARRTPTAADIESAKEIRAHARQALDKYRDYQVAEQDGYDIRFPNALQQVYHFSNLANAQYALQSFDPSRPTSLLYRKEHGSYTLVGAMYTAPRRLSEVELDARIPTSVAPWHLHTNFCVEPSFQTRRRLEPDPRFGPNGSIATAEECAAAGGTFKPVVFGWMTHIDLDD